MRCVERRIARIIVMPVELEVVGNRILDVRFLWDEYSERIRSWWRFTVFMGWPKLKMYGTLCWGGSPLRATGNPTLLHSHDSRNECDGEYDDVTSKANGTCA